MGDPWCLSHCFGECFGGRQAQTPEEAEHVQVLMGRKAWADDAAAALPELPDLRADQLSLKGSAFYRNRHHNELEPAQWHGDGACSGAPPAEALVRLRSLSSADRTSVWLRNVSDTAVHIIWLDYKGQEVSYGRLEPGGVSALYTFGNHPWVFRDVVTRRQMNCHTHQQVYFTGSDPLYAVHGHTYPPRRRDVLIEQPPLVRWSERSHRVFPWAFREAAATFLACHARMSSKNARRRTRSEDACNLGDLPAHVLPNILARCAPEVWQQSSCPHREGREDLRPALVPCSPEVFERLKPAAATGS